MVSANLEAVGSEFRDMVEERDLRGFAALAGVGAIGGVLAEMFQDRLAPRLNQPVDPATPRGLTVSFGIKAAAAVILGLVALRAGGDAALALALLGVGAAVDAGVDLIEAGDQLRTAQPAAPSRSQQRRRGPTQSTPRRRSPTNPGGRQQSEESPSQPSRPAGTRNRGGQDEQVRRGAPA